MFGLGNDSVVSHVSCFMCFFFCFTLFHDELYYIAKDVNWF